MSLPDDTLSATPVPGTFLEPDNVVRATRLEDYCSGGVAIGNPSPNLFAYNWKAWMDGQNGVIAREPYIDPEVLFTIADESLLVTDLTLALNKNNDWNIAIGIDGTIFFRWYDALLQDYTITTYPDSCSPRLTLDDKRNAFSQSNDVLFFYLRGTSLYYRQERDRYGIERFLGTYPGIVGLGRVGMSDRNRVQIELLYPAGWAACQEDQNDWAQCNDGSTEWGSCEQSG